MNKSKADLRVYKKDLLKAVKKNERVDKVIKKKNSEYLVIRKKQIAKTKEINTTKNSLYKKASIYQYYFRLTSFIRMVGQLKPSN